MSWLALITKGIPYVIGAVIAGVLVHLWDSGRIASLRVQVADMHTAQERMRGDTLQKQVDLGNSTVLAYETFTKQIADNLEQFNRSLGALRLYRAKDGVQLSNAPAETHGSGPSGQPDNSAKVLGELASRCDAQAEQLNQLQAFIRGLQKQ